MQTFRVPLYEEQQDEAFFDAYILAPTMPRQKRGVIVVVQGGAYYKTTFRETEPVAMAFCGAGYHAVTLRYRFFPHRFPLPLLDLANTVRILRQNADTWGIDPDQIILCGFSAGGHLCAALGTHWNSTFLSQLLQEDPDTFRPNRMILCYPVITAGPLTHAPSMDNLCGDDAEARKLMSLENQVTPETPPTFLWHTVSDEHVPVSNSLMFASALSQHNVSYEMHIYPKGRHGLCLASELSSEGDNTRVQPECQAWFQLALDWLKRA